MEISSKIFGIFLIAFLLLAETVWALSVLKYNDNLIGQIFVFSGAFCTIQICTSIFRDRIK